MFLESFVLAQVGTKFTLEMPVLIERFDGKSGLDSHSARAVENQVDCC